MSWLTNNFTLKLLALASAILLWIFVINEGFRIDFLEKEIPIQIYNLSEDLAVTTDVGKVKLKIRAPSSLWTNIVENIEAYVDLKNFEKGTYNVEIKISTTNPKIQILEKNPAKIRITIEPLATAKKEITVETTGSPGEGLVLGEPKLDITQAEISGAKSVLDNINKVVARIELAGENQEIKQSVKLEAYDVSGNLISNITIEPKTVNVTIPIQKEVDIKTVAVRAKISGNPAPGFLLEKVEVQPSVVTIRGKTERLKSIEYLETKEINISGLSSNKEEKTILVVPPDTTLINLEEILVKIGIASIKTVKSVEAEITFKNLSSGFEIKSYTPSVISLTVEGSQNALNLLQQNKVKINLDLLGKGSGTYSFEITQGMIQLPEGIALKSIDTKEIQVIISKH